MHHIVTLKSVQLQDWDNDGCMTFLMNRERHAFELTSFEKIIRLMKLPMEEFGGYKYGPSLHIKTYQRTLPLLMDKDYAHLDSVQNGDTVDVELELSPDDYFGRIKLTVTSIRFVRR